MSNVFAKNPSQQISLHQIENVGLGSNLATSLSPLQSIPLGGKIPPWAQAIYFIVIARPLRSAFAISPICRPDSSRIAPF